MNRYELAAKNARDAIEELRLASYAQGYQDAVSETKRVLPTTKTEVVENERDI